MSYVISKNIAITKRFGSYLALLKSSYCMLIIVQNYWPSKNAKAREGYWTREVTGVGEDLSRPCTLSYRNGPNVYPVA